MLWSRESYRTRNNNLRPYIHFIPCSTFGNCKIGRRCFFGVNSTSKDFVKIGDDVFVGMDASVTKDIADGAVVISTGTVVYEKSDRVAKAIKNLTLEFKELKILCLTNGKNMDWLLFQIKSLVETYPCNDANPLPGRR